MGLRPADKIRKKLIKAFKDFELRITCQTNLKIVNYLHVTLDFKTEKFSPYRKPDNTPSFIHARSNHPPAILKQIPRSVGHWISSLSFNEGEFQKAIPLYNEAFKASGFKGTVLFTEEENRQQKRNSRKSRHTNALCFNPPPPRIPKLLKQMSESVHSMTTFQKNHRLYKIFNRKNVKINYRCVDNMAQIIKQHNKKVSTPQTATLLETACNRRVKLDCH